MTNMDRRKFLQLGLSALAVSGCLSLQRQLFANESSLIVQKKEKSFNDYKALVCIYLAGGCDGFNLLLPADGAAYDTYKSIRQVVALEKNQILGLNPTTSQGFDIGVHYKLPGVKSLFDNQKLAFMANVGNLIQPVTHQEFISNSVPLPDQLFSHNSQEDQWQILNNETRGKPGWGGRMIDLTASSSTVPTGINLSGYNPWILGKTTAPYKLKSSGIVTYYGMDNVNNTTDMKRKELFTKMMDKSQFEHPFQKSYIDLHNNSMAIAKKIGDAFANLPSITTTVPTGNDFAQSLMSIAKMIASQPELNMKRQVFFVRAGGYDTHDSQLSSMETLFKTLDDGITMFQSALNEYGVADRTLSFTASEFGRSLTSNSDGTDHGWGSNLFAFGNPVSGGEIYGTMPSLVVDGPNDSRNGRLIPTMSADQYASSLASWFGFDETERLSLFPNLANFSNKMIPFIK
jgi:uncharacterized protein (DUF1501 family)